LFRARIDQIINMKHELVRLAGAIDWEWLDAEIAPLFSAKGRPASPTRFMIGLLLLKQVFALSDEQVCERWVYDPYFQYFTGEEFFQHAFPHERYDLEAAPSRPAQCSNQLVNGRHENSPGAEPGNRLSGYARRSNTVSTVSSVCTLGDIAAG